MFTDVLLTHTCKPLSYEESNKRPVCCANDSNVRNLSNFLNFLRLEQQMWLFSSLEESMSYSSNRLMSWLMMWESMRKLFPFRELEMSQITSSHYVPHHHHVLTQRIITYTYIYFISVLVSKHSSSIYFFRKKKMKVSLFLMPDWNGCFGRAQNADENFLFLKETAPKCWGKLSLPFVEEIQDTRYLRARLGQFVESVM